MGPSAVPLHHETDGRTLLAHSSPLRFSLSHTEELALVAIGAVDAIGVDVERSRQVPGLADVLQDVFTTRERAHIAALSAGDAHLAFLRGWTRKEAVLKAIGKGVDAMANVEVSLTAEAPQLLALYGDGPRASAWSLADLELELPFVGALAVRGPSVHYEMRDWTIS